MSTLLSLGIPDPSVISVRALSLKTRNVISTLLNPQKIIPTENGLPRDWRGLAILVGLKNEKLPVIACDTDPTARVLSLWQKQEDVPCNIKKLIDFFEELDRFDVIDDTTQLIDLDIRNFVEKPSKTEECTDPTPIHETDRQILTRDDVCRLTEGLDTQHYDAFVVFAEEDIDFATELIETLEKQYGMKLCVKERDLIGGIPFEHKAIVELIAERCNRLIVIISPAFNKCNANKFVVDYAQALGIEQGRRKIIPCLYESCEVPQELKHYFMLNYSRSGKLWNFWERLRDSIQAPPVAAPRQRKIGIQEVSVNHTEKLPELKPKSNLVQPNRNHLKPKKEGVRFGSLNNLTVSDQEKPRLTASTNALYPSPSTTHTPLSDTDSLINPETKKQKNKNWFKKLLNSKDPNRKKSKDGNQKVKEKKRIFSFNSKIKVPVLN